MEKGVWTYNDFRLLNIKANKRQADRQPKTSLVFRTFPPWLGSAFFHSSSGMEAPDQPACKKIEINQPQTSPFPNPSASPPKIEIKSISTHLI